MLEQLVAQLDTTQTEVEILQQTLGSASNITGKLAELNTTLNAFDSDVLTLKQAQTKFKDCLLYTSPSPRDGLLSRMPSSA